MSELDKDFFDFLNKNTEEGDYLYDWEEDE